LVVASARKPSAASTRAEPASQGFGITNGSPACRARNASAFSSVVADTKHDLSLFAALADAVEGRACFLEGEDRVDCRGQLSSVCAASELDQLCAIRLDHEVRRAVGLLRNRDDPAAQPDGIRKLIAA